MNNSLVKPSTTPNARAISAKLKMASARCRPVPSATSPAYSTCPLLFAPAPEDEITREDRLAETLIRRNEADTTAPPTAEALMIALAYEFAAGRHIDLATAYSALRAALQAAADLKVQGNLPSNASDQFQSVLRRVSELNDQGLRDEAGAALEAEIARNSAEAADLFHAALNQDRLRNAPEAAANRHIAHLHAAAPPGGVFKATRELLDELKVRGELHGDPFDLAVALELAKLNHARAKRGQLGQALLSLGNCHSAIGEWQSGGGHLSRAVKAFIAALKEGPRRSQPENWAIMQNNLGNVLEELGSRDGDTARLQDAVTAFHAALEVYTREASPMDWAGTQNNLGVALRALGAREGDTARLQDAVTAYHAALEVRTREAWPMNWTMTQNNLGVALQALGEREGDTARLQDAVTAYQAALEVYTREAFPMNWAGTQNNLGIALRWLGELEANPRYFDASEIAFTECLSARPEEAAPFPWAKTQWNLADLALARHALAPDPALLVRAQGHLDVARRVFAADENTHQLAECARLQAKIAAA